MSKSRRTLLPALLALSVLAAMAAPALAFPPPRPYIPPPILRPQVIPYRVNPNAFLGAPNTAQQFLFNSAVVGRAIRNIPPYALGFNPYPAPVISTGPIVPPIYPTSPYGLATNPGGFPGGATLSTSPYSDYSLSTTPGGGGFGGGYGGGYGSDIYGFGAYSPGNTLQGLASYTQAWGQYQINLQQARLTREQARQSSIDTARKRIEFEAWRERMRLTANQLRDREYATELDRARKDPPALDIWSGRALNELLRSIRANGPKTLSRGPQVDLSDVKLENVNLTNRANQGNAGLLKTVDDKNNFTMHWPAVFDREAYSETAKRLEQDLGEAVAKLKKNEKVPTAVLKDIETSYRTLDAKLNDRNATSELAPSQYINARRYLNQVGDAVKALRDPKAANYFNETWKPKGRTVAELVDHMNTAGLWFAPAAEGDQAAYSALYEALRAFEGGLSLATTQK